MRGHRRRADAGRVPRGPAACAQGRQDHRAPGHVPALRRGRRAARRGDHDPGPHPRAADARLAARAARRRPGRGDRPVGRCRTVRGPPPPEGAASRLLPPLPRHRPPPVPPLRPVPAFPAGPLPPPERPGHPVSARGAGAGSAAGQDTAGRRARARAPRRLALRLATAAAAVVILAGGGYVIARVLSAGHRGRRPAPPPAPPLPAARPARRPRQAGAPRPLRRSCPRRREWPAAGRQRHPRTGPASCGPRSVPSSSVTPPPVTSARPRPRRPTLAVTGFPHLARASRHFAGSERPRLVDIARYGTRPAAVIVVPAPGTDTGERVGRRPGLFRPRAAT